MISRKQRITAFMTAVIFGAVIFGSLLFIAASSEHICAEEDCHICEMIQRCEKLPDILGCAAKPCVFHFAALFFFAAVLLCGRAVFDGKTLISLKVELLI